MAHFAQLDETNTVLQVIVVNNSELLEDDVENEMKGRAFCKSLLGGDWVQTSYNGNIRKQFAGIGYTYNSQLDIFIAPKCHEQALLNELGDWDCDNEEHGVK